MNTEKIKTLEHVHDALEIVEHARATTGLTKIEIKELEKASVSLRNLERTIIRIKTVELIDTLSADAKALTELADKIKKSAEKLADVANGIEKAAKVVEAFVKIVATAIATGFI